MASSFYYLFQQLLRWRCTQICSTRSPVPVSRNAPAKSTRIRSCHWAKCPAQIVASVGIWRHKSAWGKSCKRRMSRKWHSKRPCRTCRRPWEVDDDHPSRRATHDCASCVFGKVCRCYVWIISSAVCFPHDDTSIEKLVYFELYSLLYMNLNETKCPIPPFPTACT